MISVRSITNYISTNLFLLTISAFHLVSINVLTFVSDYVPISLGIAYPTIFIIGYTPIVLLSNYLLINVIDYKLKDINFISPRQSGISLLDSGEIEKHLYVLKASAIEAVSVCIFTYFLPCTKTGITDIVMFIPYSFLFEVTFDLLHYIAHRLCHTKHLYKLHKTHHKYSHPTSIITFYQDPLDLLISNVIPFGLTFYMLRPRSLATFIILMTYKKYTEISGHSGKSVESVCAFPQFIWLPKLFGIELYTKDHDLHHTLNNCNYSKRFTLWDKAFETYRSKKYFNIH